MLLFLRTCFESICRDDINDKRFDVRRFKLSAGLMMLPLMHLTVDARETGHIFIQYRPIKFPATHCCYFISERATGVLATRQCSNRVILMLWRRGHDLINV